MSLRRNVHDWCARLTGVVLLVSAFVVTPIEAYAQVRSCSQLSGTIQQLERSREYRTLQQNSATMQQLGSDLSRLENAFVQANCQQILNSGQSQNRDCSRAAQRIQGGRRDMATLTERVQAGQAVAQQREQLLGQMQAQRCGTNSEVNITVRDNEPRGFFQQLFDSLSGNDFRNQNEIVVDPYSGYRGNTVRSVCVRACDGYYWPVSFSTVPEYLSNDLLQCQQQGRGADVDLYYYSNPGQTPNDMVNMNGQLYSSLPNAFRYRNEFDASCIARPETSFGTIEIVVSGGQTRATLNIDEREVPLPLRDPRRETQTITAEVIETVRIPLPRPRPQLDGEGNPVTVALPATAPDIRLFDVGGKIVRLVGPDTPYAQAVEEDS